MRLYHGSNVMVAKPKILAPARALDFGPGFYTTSSSEQAERWARLQARRRREGIATVSVYEFNKNAISSDLDIELFDAPDGKWLDFVTANRKGIPAETSFDLVIGPVANDNTMTVISDYTAGQIDRETALILLKPQKLADQYAFLTNEALLALKFVKAVEYGE